MGRKKSDKEPTFPFGKHKGRSLPAIMREEPSYLCWFVETVDGCPDIKEAIVALPGFREEQVKYDDRKHRRETTTRKLIGETVSRMMGDEQRLSPEQLDDLCDRLFNAPPDAS
jgi:hypothetical protein